MNKIIFFISLIAIITLTGCQNNQTTNNQAPREIELNTQIEAMQLPADFVVPATLPTTITDPVLMEGWITLYNQTKSYELWNGTSLSGQQLAQYILDNNIIITWNTNPAYSGSWVDRGETGNIYINPELKDANEAQMTRLVGTLAHEIFHSTTPFSQVEDTLYEEYWAFYVGSKVSGKAQADFNSFNPEAPASLKLWFETNNRSDYLDELEMYPENIVAISSN